MKKGTKVILCISAGLIGIGIILTTIGSFAGGWRTTAIWAMNGELSIGEDNWKIFDWTPTSYSSIYNEIQINDNEEVYSGSAAADTAAGWNTSEVQNLAMSIDAARVSLEESDNDKISISYQNVEELQYYIQNGTLIVSEKKKTNVVTNYSNYYGNCKITLFIPKDHTFNEVDIEIGGGNLEVDRLEAAKVDIAIGAGKATLAELRANELEAEVGAGDVTIDSVDIQNADLSVGLGNMQITGKITGELDAECSMGNLELTLDGELEDHSYEIECAMGNITLDGRSYTGLAKEVTLHYNNNSPFSLECAMGNISVRFR